MYLVRGNTRLIRRRCKYKSPRGGYSVEAFEFGIAGFAVDLFECH